jgi:hypothetical protein
MAFIIAIDAVALLTDCAECHQLQLPLTSFFHDQHAPRTWRQGRTLVNLVRKMEGCCSVSNSISLVAEAVLGERVKVTPI